MTTDDLTPPDETRRRTGGSEDPEASGGPPFQFMADAAPVMIWISDTRKACIWFNRGWLEFRGRTLKQELGDEWLSGVHRDDLRRVLETYGSAFDARVPFRLEYRLQRHDGQYRWILDQGAPFHEAGGAFKGYIGSCVDITENKTTESELKGLSESLAQRVAERTRVAEQRAEQLRILAFELTHAEQRERRRLARVMYDNLQQLIAAGKVILARVRLRSDDAGIRADLQQVADLLDDAMRAAHTVTAELSPPILYDAGPGPALEWLARRIKERFDVDIEVVLPEVLPAIDEDSAALLFEAGRALLLNVVKHAGTPRARMALEFPDRQHVVLEVSDHGVGFDPALVAGDETPRDRFGLFGLRRRVEMLGGTLRIDSAYGRGTRVALTLALRAPDAAQPRAAAHEPTPSPAGEGADDKIRVLLADDHRIMREGVTGLLREHQDIEVVAEAADGLAAVELAMSHKPDVVIMDISMPGLDGIEATRRILAALPKTCIIGLSMHERNDMAAAMRHAGAAAYLTKGGPSEALIAAVRECSAGRSWPSPS